MQENSEKIAIFWIIDTHEGHWTAFRLLEMGRDSYGNPSVILYVTVGSPSGDRRVTVVIYKGLTRERRNITSDLEESKEKGGR